MEKNNLEKLLQKIESDADLKELGKLDEKTRTLLCRIADEEVPADQAVEIFLDEKEKL